MKRWFDVSAYPSRNGLSVFFKDITQRKASEELLTELNQSLEQKAKELASSNTDGGKIFNLFQRLHNNETYKGTGLGLAISKKIVEDHRGEIWIDMDEGKGTVFHFTIEKRKI